jgi:hypothetical protein
MLEKIKVIPLSVIISVTFLVCLMIAGLVFAPVVFAALIVTGLVYLSIVRLINYWINGE